MAPPAEDMGGMVGMMPPSSFGPSVGAMVSLGDDGVYGMFWSFGRGDALITSSFNFAVNKCGAAGCANKDGSNDNGDGGGGGGGDAGGASAGDGSKEANNGGDDGGGGGGGGDDGGGGGDAGNAGGGDAGGGDAGGGDTDGGVAGGARAGDGSKEANNSSSKNSDSQSSDDEEEREKALASSLIGGIVGGLLCLSIAIGFVYFRHGQRAAGHLYDEMVEGGARRVQG